MNRVKSVFREIASYVKIKVYKVSLKRWACFIALMVFVLLYYHNFFNTINKDHSLLDYLLYFGNNPFIICFYFMFALIILLSDVYSSSNNSYDTVILIKLKRRRWNTCNILFIVIICIFIVLVTVLFNVVICLLDYHTITNASSLYGLKIDPAAAVLIGYMFITLRLIMMGLLIYITNLISKLNVGFICAIIVTFIDRFFYEMFNIMKPIFMLPIEHTRILYTEAVAPADQYAVRIPFGMSFLYWAILILLLLIILDNIIKKKDFLALINRK